MVRLHFMTEIPQPLVILDYLPHGDLEQLHRTRCLTTSEVVETLVQGLSALDYLHDQTPPIVHRDIKPDNILVQSREPFHIRLGDFGLSKASEDLKTICGTPTYFAPEVARYYRSSPPPNHRYTNAVDIWSLGVVVSRFAHNLPFPGIGAGVKWCNKIATHLKDREPDGLVKVLLKMVAMDPRQRHSAKECLRDSMELDRQSRSSTPTPGSYNSFRSHVPQARSSSPGIQLSIHDPDKPQDGGSKRLSSPAVAVDEDSRSVRAFTPDLSVSNISLLRFLTRIRGGDSDGGPTSTITSDLLDVLRELFERLNITEPDAYFEYANQCTVIIATQHTHRIRLAGLTSSDCAQSATGLAQHLIDALQQLAWDRYTCTSSESRSDQLYFDDNLGTFGARSTPAMDATVLCPPCGP
nr:putative serine/threonine-protein kinase fhkb [Quercus suber]